MRELVAGLTAASRTFDTGAARKKLVFLAAAARQPGLPAAFRLAWHDQVLFCLAHPDGVDVRRAAERELRRIASLLRKQPPAALRTLANSGVAGSWVQTAFSPDLLRWLVARARRDIDLAWDETDGLEATLPLLALPVEADGLLAPELSTEEWVRAGSGKTPPLAWVLDRVDALGMSPELRERFFATMGLEVRWRLGRGSRTLTRFPSRPVFYQREPLPRGVALGEILGKRLPAPVRLNRRAVTGLIDTARAVLAARGRETDPVTWANPSETTLFRLDRGIDVALFGLLPERRLPIESYFGFVAARNRVPIAYGGGWVFFGRCEIGVNLFEEFRGGESGHVFAQVLRVYRQRFRTRQFLVDPFQFGKDNPEAIRSGAYWFYHRLGFRLTDPLLRSEAEAEYHRIQQRPGYRSPARVLRRLTASRLFLDVGTAERNESPDIEPWRPAAPELAQVSLAATSSITRAFDGDREAACQDASMRVARWLGRGAAGTTGQQRLWFGRMAPLIAMLPGLSAWDRDDREQLGRILRAKGGTRERDYALALQRHRRLEAAFYAVTASP
jgi:hypothetical protein